MLSGKFSSTHKTSPQKIDLGHLFCKVSIDSEPAVVENLWHLQPPPALALQPHSPYACCSRASKKRGPVLSATKKQGASLDHKCGATIR